METFEQLINAVINKQNLYWNDPEYIAGNDYKISYIEQLNDDFDEYTPILIQYNEGLSEAQVFLHEIVTK